MRLKMLSLVSFDHLVSSEEFLFAARCVDCRLGSVFHVYFTLCANACTTTTWACVWVLNITFMIHAPLRHSVSLTTDLEVFFVYSNSFEFFFFFSLVHLPLAYCYEISFSLSFILAILQAESSAWWANSRVSIHVATLEKIYYFVLYKWRSPFWSRAC